MKYLRHINRHIVRRTYFALKNAADSFHYAGGLGYDVEVPYRHHTEYTSENHTLADERWEGLSIDPMVIAPTKEEQERLQLPESWAFPWDSNRNIYFVKVFHQMHCLVKTTILEPVESMLKSLRKSCEEPIISFGLEKSPQSHLSTLSIV